MPATKLTAAKSLIELHKLNERLVKLHALRKSVDHIMEDLHNADSQEEIDNRNDMLKKSSSSWLSWNTFELLPAEYIEPAEYTFYKKVKRVAVELDEARSLFSAKSSLFDKKGNFKRSTAITAALSELGRLIDEVTQSIDVTRGQYHREQAESIRGPNRRGVYSYLEPVQTTRINADGSTFALKGWVQRLRSRSAYNQLYLEIEAMHQGSLAVDGYLEDVNSAFESRLLWAYIKTRQDAQDELLKGLQKAERRFLTEKERLAIHRLIQKDIDDGRLVYIQIVTENKKSKTKAMINDQIAVSLALMATFAEAAMASYSVAEAFGFHGQNLIAYLQANPWVFAAAVAAFAIMLAINLPLFKDMLKDSLSTLTKNRLAKEANDTSYDASKKWLLALGIVVSAAAGVGMAAMAFNSCQVTFASLLGTSMGSTSVLAISWAIASLWVVTTISFGLWLTKSILNNSSDIKKSMNRLFFKGRNKSAKIALFVASLVASAGLLVAAIAVGFSSLKTWANVIRGHGATHIVHTTFDRFFSALSVIYYAFSRFRTNRSLFAISADRLTSVYHFYQNRHWAESLAISVIAVPVRVFLEAIFFSATITMMSLRLAGEAMAVIANLVLLMLSPISAIGIGIVSAVRGERFADHFSRYAGSVDSLKQAVGHARWLKHTYLYCLKRSGPLAIFYDVTAIKMLGKDAHHQDELEAQPACDDLAREKMSHNKVVKRSRADIALRGYFGRFFKGPNKVSNASGFSPSSPARVHVKVDPDSDSNPVAVSP